MNASQTEVVAVTAAANQLAVQPIAGPMAGALQMLQAGVSIEQMQGIMALQKEYEANEARKAYVADMAEFKKNPPVILKDKEVAYSGTQYMHATLGGVTEAVVAALAQHGFSHSWDTTQRDDGQVFVTCILTHRMGHSESTALNSAPDQSGKKNNIQALASTVSYLSRYTLLLACGLATKDMGADDGRDSDGGAYNSASLLDMWIDLVNEASTLEALRATRKSAIAAFEKIGDVGSWNELKPVLDARKAALAAVQ